MKQFFGQIWNENTTRKLINHVFIRSVKLARSPRIWPVSWNLLSELNDNIFRKLERLHAKQAIPFVQWSIYMKWSPRWDLVTRNREFHVAGTSARWSISENITPIVINCPARTLNQARIIDRKSRKYFCTPVQN